MKMDPVVSTRAKRFIPVSRPDLTHGEDRAVAECVLKGWISQGAIVEEFERRFAQSHGHTFGIACHSGTAALKLAIAAAITKPQAIIMPTLTMVAVPNAAIYNRCQPLLIDSDETGNIDANLLESCIQSDSVVVIPHLYGRVANDAVRACASRCTLIEDCAECHYAKYDTREPVGSRATMSCFSFYANKIVTTGEGGMVCTSDPALAQRLRSLRSHAFTPGRHFLHQELAWGDRMTDMQAAIGLRQHEVHDELLRNRDEIAMWYNENLSKYLPRPVADVWWVYPILCESESYRDALRDWLAAGGVDTRTFFVPMHQQKHVARCHAIAGDEPSYPVAETLSARGLYLPLWSGMSRSDVIYIASLVNMFSYAHLPPLGAP